MKAPTTEEVQSGYDGITADGPGASITTELGLLVILDPRISDTLKRMVRAALALNLVQGEPSQITGLVAGALVYGLHLGLHIGEARGKEGR